MDTLQKALAGFIKELPYSSRTLFITGLVIVSSIVLMAVLALIISPYDPLARVAPPYQPPSISHLFGTNHLGYDVLSRVIWGSRTVLYIVVLSAILSMGIGVPLGITSGYYGGLLDRVLSVIMDSIYAFPSLILAIAVAAVLGPSPINVAISLAIVYVPTYFRMVRSEALRLKNMLFIEAQVLLGYPKRYIMLSIIRNSIQTILVIFTLSTADAVLTEAALGYLGLSVTWLQPDWGLDLRSGQGEIINGYWWISMFPGFFIVLLSLGFAFIGEALSDYFAVRTKT